MSIVEANFYRRVQEKNFPKGRVNVTPQDANLDREKIISLFISQLISRHLDIIARDLKTKNRGFYTIGSSGHEGNAALGSAFRHTDLAFLHYRSAAQVIQRMREAGIGDPITDLLYSLMGSSSDPISSGRHKVLGSLPLFIPPQTSTIASHCPKAVGAAFALPLRKTLHIEGKCREDGIVLCSFGDASVNHACTQTALNCAQWMSFQNYPLPLIFICEDNGIGISVTTPSDWIQQSIKNRVALTYLQADGLNILDVYRVAKQAEHVARVEKKPVFLHMKCVRLFGHAGTDIESQYLSEQQIEKNEEDDPLLHTARILIENNYLTSEEIIKKYRDIKQEIECRERDISPAPILKTAQDVMSSLVPHVRNHSFISPKTSERKKILSEIYPAFGKPLTLAQAINLTLADIMFQYPNVLVFGEDVAKKGGVYRITAGLQKKFGAARVFDTLLDETTILGTAIGLAHHGILPIPEIQFLAYLHNAEDQLRGEAATLSFFSNGQFQNPMVVRIPSLAYQKGFGGHFHNDNSIAVLRDIPGIIVACPSNALDAVRMLKYCVKKAWEEGRVVIFLEPIALYSVKDLHQKGDGQWLFQYPIDTKILPKEVGCKGNEKATFAIISYGNGFYLSCQAAQELMSNHQIAVKVIDLRYLVPLPEKSLLVQVNGCENILIVEECRRSGSISEALVTLFVEKLIPFPKVKRLTAEDCFIPLGEAMKLMLPSKEKIVKMVLEMGK